MCAVWPTIPQQFNLRKPHVQDEGKTLFAEEPRIQGLRELGEYRHPWKQQVGKEVSYVVVWGKEEFIQMN